MEIDVANLYQIVFREIKGVGNQTLLNILTRFGDFKKAFNSSMEELKGVIPDKKILEEINEKQRHKEAILNRITQIERDLKVNNIKFIPFNSIYYPKQLKIINNPPVCLFLKGNLIFNELEKSISIVGTRNASAYGRERARIIAKELAEKNYIIVSGLARGIDMHAHLGALEGKGKTVAILGSGVNNIYPTEHSELANDIMKRGAIISEFGIDEKVQRYNLSNRNRITSALSLASLIIEGSKDSGTRHEANYAREQKKKLFVLRPIHYSHKVAELPRFLKENNGAIEIESADDLLRHLNSTDIEKDLMKIPDNKVKILEETNDFLFIKKDFEIKKNQLIS
ncbi:MAG: DNA-processing protein DprA [Candidatus Helarchaeota archaeon]